MKNKKILIIIILIVILAFFSVIFSLINIGNTKIYPNIKIQEILVSGKTQEEVSNILNKKYSEKKLVGLKLTHEDYETTISYNQMGITFNISDAIDKAYSLCRSGNIIINNYSIITRFFATKNIDISLNYDENSINKIIEDIESKLPDVMTDNDYYIEDNNLVIIKGKKGVQIDKDSLKSAMIDKINDFKTDDNVIQIPILEKTPDEIDIEKIAKEIKSEPQDAYLSKNPLELHADKDGIDLAMSIEDIKKLLEEDKEEFSIPLNITKANITVLDLGEDAFPNLLGTCTTNYDASNINRNNNLIIAAKKLNGTIVNPNETFSYNQTIGQRTIAAGFKEAKAYAGGKVVLDVGGGICQLSSTLYNSVLLSNLEIVERRNHSFQTSYLPAGLDATVSWGSIDFRFKNTRKYPIKIVAKAQDGVVKVDLYGIKQEDDYDVKLDAKEISIIPMKTITEKDSSLAKGSQVVTQYGDDGCTSETYKILSKNGIVVSKTLISKDTYNDLPKIIKENN